MNGEKNNKDWIWTSLVLAILIGGFFILKKGIQMSRENNYYAYYSDVKGLQASSPVILKGVTIGKISDVALNEEDRKVKVTLTISKEDKLPIGTVALLASGGMMGDKIIRIIPGTGPGYIKDGGSIPTAFDTSVMQTSVRVRPYIETFKAALSVTDSTLNAFNMLVRKGFLTSVTHMFIDIEEETKSYAVLANKLNAKGDDIVEKINSINTTAASIAQNTNSTSESIRNADAKMSKAAKSDIGNNIRELQSIFKETGNMTAKISSRDSGLGELLGSKKTYKKATENSGQINKELQQLKDNPPGFSIFGGKK